MSEQKAIIGARISQARFEAEKRLGRRLSHREVADAVGVSCAVISIWESGRGAPTVEQAGPLAEFLGVTPAYLLFGETGKVITYPASAVLTDVQVAEALQIGERSIERLDIPCHYIGTRTRRYIWGEVLQWLKTKKAA